MAASLVLSSEPRVMQTITRYLEVLGETVDGDELRGLIARILRRHSHAGPPGVECLAELYATLDAYARDPVSLPRMRIRARLLQQHIAPYLSERNAKPASRLTSAADDFGPSTANTTARNEGRSASAAETGLNPGAVEGVLERPGEKERAAEQKHAEKYESLQRSENDAWQAIYGTVRDYRRLKDAWMKSLDELAAQRDALEHKLVKTTAQLSRLEAENERLRAEREKARAATDRPTHVHSLPQLLSRINAHGRRLAKRDTFIQQVQAEIKRIKRSGAPLALGLIGVQSLDDLTDRYGADAAAAALRCYAEEVLSNFRAYDIVALYERDQFAVMFPDTCKDGARRALEKAYKRAGETHLNHAGTSIPLPPFAGALVSYSPGEDPATLLGRVRQVLDEVRARGRGGVAFS